MSRAYAQIRAKTHYVYSVCDLMRLFGVTANTVSNWVKERLTPSDAATPYVFRGAEVKRFHDARRIETTHPLRKGQFKCMSCRSRSFPEPHTLTRVLSGCGKVILRGACSTCDRLVSKIVNETDCDALMNCADTNTSLTSLDEGIGPAEAGTGIPAGPMPSGLSSPNDRVLHDWRIFDIFDHFGDSAAGETLEDKELMIRFNECDLDRDSAEWRRAKRLKQERSDMKGRPKRSRPN